MVTGCDIQGGRIRAVETDQGRIETEQVLIWGIATASAATATSPSWTGTGCWVMPPAEIEVIEKSKKFNFSANAEVGLLPFDLTPEEITAIEESKKLNFLGKGYVQSQLYRW